MASANERVSSAQAHKLIKRPKRPHSPSRPPPSRNDSLTTLQQGHDTEPAVMPSLSSNFLLRSRSLSASKDYSAGYGSTSKDFRASSSSLWPSGWRMALRNSSLISRSSSQATVGTVAGSKESNSSSPVDFVLSPGWEVLPRIPHVSPLEIEFNHTFDQRDHTDRLQPTTVCVIGDARQETSQNASTASQQGSVDMRVMAADHQPQTKKKHKFTLHLDDELDFEGTAGDRQSVGTSMEVPGSRMISPPSFHFHLPSRLNSNIAPSQVSPPMSSANAAPASPSSPVRPGLTRRPAGFGPQPGVSRRYTFAMAMTDEGITDEALVRELERIRAVRTLSSASPSRANSQTNLPTMLTTHIPENNEDIGDVWDTDGGQSDAEFGPETSGQGEQKNELLMEGRIVCDSPSSEGCTTWPSASFQSPPAIPPPRSSSIPRQGRSSLDSQAHPSPSKQPAATWLTTRHALLTCRELVRTERHYLSSLISLLSCETSSPPPPLMLHYAAVLVKASAALLEKMEKSPTPSGVSKAFAALESELEAAYIGWCGVVGSWFVDGDQSKGLLIPEKSVADRSRASIRRLSKGRTNNAEEPSISRKPVSSWKSGFDTIVATSTVTATRSRSTVSTASGANRSNLHFNVDHTFSERQQIKHTRPSLLRKSQTTSAPPSRVPSFSDAVNLEELSRLYSMPTIFSDKGSSKPPRKPSIRDLAILPTQRIMRYVLLFKDLESSTPYSSSSRFAVERAAGIADRMAKKCDRAQNNAAFIVSPSSSNPNQNPVEVSPPIPPTPVVSPNIPRASATVRLVEPANYNASLPALATDSTIEEEQVFDSKGKGKEKEKTRTLPRKLTKRSRASLSVHTKHRSELGHQQEDLEALSPSDTVSIYTSSEHGHGSTSPHIPPLPSGSHPLSAHPLSDDEFSARRWRSQSHTNVPATLRASRRTSMINWTSAFSSMWSGNDQKSPRPPSAFSAVDLVASASGSK
ncbi:hypothetical protein BKA70DRAFT_1215412 [Coprinopsis sp. MPI-PUGE-AT-0042]|nr:hypothetical protein BKA70DRAFT_1215412 [Coprinopsis sp. MPI-PUGE-AT-0042]